MTESERLIPFARRVLFCLGAWIVALLGAYFLLGMQEESIQMFPWFPLGIAIMIPAKKVENLMILGWVIYGLLTFITLMIRKRRAFFIAFSILATVLVLNVIGCRVALGAPPPIVP